MTGKPILGIIGGSGLYQFESLAEVETLEVNTPFGKPSSPIFTGLLADRKVAFLARHGIGHFINPTEVNYRANIYAFKMLGIQHVVSISACASLRDDFASGHIVLPDQLFNGFLRYRSILHQGFDDHLHADRFFGRMPDIVICDMCHCAVAHFSFPCQKGFG